MTPTDSELVARAIGGSQPACREIVSLYQRPLFNLIVRMVRDRAIAEDLLQETFLKAFSHLERFDPRYKLSNWLFKIAHNTVIDYLRQRKPVALPLDSLDSGERALADPSGGPASGDPVEAIARAEMAELLGRAVAALRPEYRQVVVLRYHEDLSHEEIADIMGIPVGTAKSHLHRARVELAGVLRRLLPPDVWKQLDSGGATSDTSEP